MVRLNYWRFYTQWLRDARPGKYRLPRMRGGGDPIGEWVGTTLWMNEHRGVTFKTPAKLNFGKSAVCVDLDLTKKYEKQAWSVYYTILKRNSQVLNLESFSRWRTAVEIGEALIERDEELRPKELLFELPGMTFSEPDDWEHGGGEMYSPYIGLSNGKRFGVQLARKSYRYEKIYDFMG